MSNFKLIPDGGNDEVYTPLALAEKIVNRLNIQGTAFEPCYGEGAFIKAFEKKGLQYDYCDLSQGKDFFDYNNKVNWIVTNPPWSQARKFLQHSMRIADNIAFLITINHILALKARLRDVEQAGFSITAVYTVDTPKSFPQSGFQLGVVVLQRVNTNTIIWEEL